MKYLKEFKIRLRKEWQFKFGLRLYCICAQAITEMTGFTSIVVEAHFYQKIDVNTDNKTIRDGNWPRLNH